MRICICGGGSLGIVCAGIFVNQGHEVNILTGHPDKWSKQISVLDQKKKVYSGCLSMVTENPKVAITRCEIILLCVPGYLIEKTLTNIKPYLSDETIVGSIVSSTGFFFIAHDILESQYCLFGFQRVPFISRVREYGAVGDLLGYKDSLNVAIENSCNKESLRITLEELFLTPIKLLDSFYEASLTNSNPILHTGRLYSMWKNYNGEIYKSQGLFYSEWTEDASELLIAMDSEFMSLIKKLRLKEDAIPSLLDYYESKDAASLTNKIKSIPAFKNILSPMKEMCGGWVPDFNSRYFTEDFPYGLRFIRDLALKYDVQIPTIEKVYKWGMSKINLI